MSVTQLMALSATNILVHTSRDHGVSDWICVEDGTATYSIPYDGTTIIETDPDGSNSVTKVNNASSGSRGTFAITKYKLYFADKAVNLFSEGFHHRIVPITNKGTKFGNYASRAAPSTIYIYNPGTSSVTISVYDNVTGGIGGTATSTISLGSGRITTYSTSTLSAWVLFESTGDIVMTATQTGADSSVLNPADTNAFIRRATTAWRDMNNSTPSTIGSPAYTASDTDLVVGAVIADGSGGDYELALGINNLANRYSFGNAIGDYFVLSPYASTTVNVKYWNGSSWATHATHSLNGSLASPAVHQEGTLSGAGTNLQSGATNWLWEANNPIFLAINDTSSDEESMLGWIGGRKSSQGNRNGVISGWTPPSFSHVGASYYRATTDVSTHTITVPSGAQSGDLLVAFVYQDDTSTVTQHLGDAEGEYGTDPLTEWVLVDSGGSNRWQTYYRKWDGVTSSFTQVKSSTDTAAGGCVAFRPPVDIPINSLTLVATAGQTSAGPLSSSITSVSPSASPGARLQGYFLSGRAQAGNIQNPTPTFTPSTGWTHVDGEPLFSADYIDYAYKLPLKGDTYVSQTISTDDAGRQHHSLFVIDAESTVVVPGGHLFNTPGTHTFTVPNGVTSISAVAVGGGGGGGGTSGSTGSGRSSGGGGALYYVNSLSVTPGESLTVIVGAGGSGGGTNANGSSGGNSSIARGATTLLLADAGNGGTNGGAASGGQTSSSTGDGGGNGGNGALNTSAGAGGGGAGGYSGAGGNGSSGGNAGNGSGGGGGGGGRNLSNPSASGGGGGVGVYGQGSNGVGAVTPGDPGGGGSGGSSGTSTTAGVGGAYGGGGGSRFDDGSAGGGGSGASGAVRIIWSNSGLTRTFPSTNVAVSTTYTDGQTESLN